MQYNRLITLMLALALAGCSPAAVTQPTGTPTPVATPTATVLPTLARTSTPAATPGSMPPPTPAQTPESTVTVAPIAVLPAPLYINDRGWLYRMAQDLSRRDLIAGTKTNGDGGIGEFAVSPVDGRLAYLTHQTSGDAPVGVLVRAEADGSSPEVLLEGNYFSSPLWSPDGTQIALGVQELIGGPPPTLEPGTYLIPASGGAPWLAQLSDRAVPHTIARAYVPQAWSPDGQHLLLKVYGLATGVCELAVLPVIGGPVLLITPPEGMTISCERAVWRGDGGAIAMNMFRQGSGAVEPGLWQADPRNGVISELVPPRGPEGWITLNSIGTAADGGWLALVAFTATPPVEGVIPEHQVAHIAADGAITVLRPERYLLNWWRFAWAPDGSGLVVQRSSTENNLAPLLWLPLQGEAVELAPPLPQHLVTVAWGAIGDDP
ncbi:MAG: hypothetical protein SNJ69_17785 [Chloroflexaceae bacterium]